MRRNSADFSSAYYFLSILPTNITFKIAKINLSSCRANLMHFIQKLTPLAEELGMYLAIHPDDPPRSLLGLPRVVSTSQDVQKLLGITTDIIN